MNTGRFAAPGKTRTCPHCKATILESATVCPGCNHHLRFDSISAGQRTQPVLTPLRVEGTLRHPANRGTWEYSVVLTIRNARGQEIARQIVGVGALQPAEERVFTLAVEVFKPAEVSESKAPTAPASRPPEARAPGQPMPPGAPSRPSVPAAGAPSRPSVPAAGTPSRPSTSPPAAPPRPSIPSAPAASGPSATRAGAAPRPSAPAGSNSSAFRDPRLSPSESKPQPKRS
jgi:hypothetical protein